jgi:hypothetical protein
MQLWTEPWVPGQATAGVLGAGSSVLFCIRDLEEPHLNSTFLPLLAFRMRLPDIRSGGGGVPRGGIAAGSNRVCQGIVQIGRLRLGELP